jgi:hypothetical protein
MVSEIEILNSNPDATVYLPFKLNISLAVLYA